MNINNHPQANDVYTRNLANQPPKKATQMPIEPKTQDPKGTVEDKVDLSKLDALREQPEIRPEVVAKGKELLNDPNFPSQEIVSDLSPPYRISFRYFWGSSFQGMSKSMPHCSSMATKRSLFQEPSLSSPPVRK